VSSTTKIIICTERGILEKYSLLLCRSLRQFGGDMSNTEIYSIAPRKGYYPSQKTIRDLELIGVKHLNIDLNTTYPDDYFVNKFVAGSYIESKFPDATVVFLDSDQIILNPPTGFILPKDIDVMVRVVDRKNIGVSSENDVEWDYWKALYQAFAINYTTLSQVETSSGERIYPYFQGGMIISKASNGLFSQIKRNYAVVRENKIRPKAGNFFLEQSTYSATISQMQLNYLLVPNTYNYPLSLHEEISSKVSVQDFTQLHTAHYHDLLTTKPYPNYFDVFLNTTEKGQWLSEQIKALDIKPEGAISSFIAKLRKKLSKKFF